MGNLEVTYTQRWKYIFMPTESSFFSSFCTDDRENYGLLLVLQSVSCAICLVCCFYCWSPFMPLK